MWRWTFHDGSTWAAVMFIGTDIVGWSCLTQQEEEYPVVGVFVEPQWRGQGLAERLIKSLLLVLEPSSDTILAVASNWPKYPALLERLGYQYQEWN